MLIVKFKTEFRPKPVTSTYLNHLIHRTDVKALASTAGNSDSPQILIQNSKMFTFSLQMYNTEVSISDMYPKEIIDLKFNSGYVKCGSTRQDGSVGQKQLGHSSTTIPEEQRVPRQKTGAEVRLSHQYGNLKGDFKHLFDPKK